MGSRCRALRIADPVDSSLQKRCQFASTARVMGPVQGFQTLTCDMCIDLRRREIAVTKQQLHHSEICIMVHEMRCKGMA